MQMWLLKNNSSENIQSGIKKGALSKIYLLFFFFVSSFGMHGNKTFFSLDSGKALLRGCVCVDGWYQVSGGLPGNA